MQRIRFVLLILIVLISGCTGGRLVGEIPTIDRGKFATVHIVRPSKFSGCFERRTIQLNGKDFYYLACGEHIVFRVSAEEPLTISETTSVEQDYYELYPENGKHYYLHNECNGLTCRLEKTNKKIFRSLVNDCKHIDLNS